MPNTVTVLATGGTIDKSYPTGQCGAYAFEFGPTTGAERIISRGRATTFVAVCKVLQKDSQDVNADDRQILLNAVLKYGPNAKTGEICCVITHGTDTIIETARFLYENLNRTFDNGIQHNGVIILTGAFIPERMKSTDADFNLGFALGCANIYSNLTAETVRNEKAIRSVIVRLAIQGQLFNVGQVKRLGDGSFVTSDVEKS